MSVMTVTFTVPCIPIAQPRQRHRIVDTGASQYVQNYTPTKHPVNAFKSACQFAYRQHVVGCPIQGPVGLTMTFVLPRPKAKTWKTKPMPRYWHTGKPDTDNLTKAVKDALSGLAWRDDAQVCDERAVKWVASGSEQPHVEITITELE